MDRVLKTNVYAVLWLTQAAQPHLPPGSSIINTSSVQAYQPSTQLLDYAATKAAINNLTVNLAAEPAAKPHSESSTDCGPSNTEPG